MVDESPEYNEVKESNYIKKVSIYTRVSNRERKPQLEYQVNRLTEFAIKNGFIVENIYREIASGMNDDRKILWKMIESKPDIILIENKDRLTRFGFNYLKRLLSKLGTEIIVVNNNEDDKQDLINDFVSIITSFCCRLYGLRRGKSKSDKIKQELDDLNN
jgi:predicted site-specific integrase-resolvase